MNIREIDRLMGVMPTNRGRKTTKDFISSAKVMTTKKAPYKTGDMVTFRDGFSLVETIPPGSPAVVVYDWVPELAAEAVSKRSVSMSCEGLNVVIGSFSEDGTFILSPIDSHRLRLMTPKEIKALDNPPKPEKPKGSGRTIEVQMVHRKSRK